MTKRYIDRFLFDKTSNAPLTVFRILFGVLMLFSTLRFVINGWVEQFYIQPEFHFKYYGFSWVEALPGQWMYVLFGAMIVSTVLITLGLFYRLATLTFFLSFTWVELIDKTYYLNHYYFVSLVALLMVFLPAHHRFSLDVKWRKINTSTECQRWHINIIKFQLFVVYFYAGLAKINYDWLMEAQPLSNWLHAHHHLPLIGSYLKTSWMPYLMSWCGMLYDLFIVFLLLWRKTRILGFTLVVFFHVFTWLLFPIGVFPWVMILSTLIFFSPSFHEKMLSLFEKKKAKLQTQHVLKGYNRIGVKYLVTAYVVFQLLFPFRYLLYKGDLFWKEQGYRFSWRVMLTEKAGHATFYVEDKRTGKSIEVDNTDFLTDNQIKMMATQPDMILDYAHYLKETFQDSVIEVNHQTYVITNPKIRADVRVTLNGSGSQPFVSKRWDLSTIKNDLSERYWVESFYE